MTMFDKARSKLKAAAYIAGGYALIAASYVPKAINALGNFVMSLKPIIKEVKKRPPLAAGLAFVGGAALFAGLTAFFGFVSGLLAIPALPFALPLGILVLGAAAFGGILFTLHALRSLGVTEKHKPISNAVFAFAIMGAASLTAAPALAYFASAALTSSAFAVFGMTFPPLGIAFAIAAGVALAISALTFGVTAVIEQKAAIKALEMKMGKMVTTTSTTPIFTALSAQPQPQPQLQTQKEAQPVLPLNDHLKTLRFEGGSLQLHPPKRDSTTQKQEKHSTVSRIRNLLSTSH